MSAITITAAVLLFMQQIFYVEPLLRGGTVLSSGNKE